MHGHEHAIHDMHCTNDPCLVSEGKYKWWTSTSSDPVFFWQVLQLACPCLHSCHGNCVAFGLVRGRATVALLGKDAQDIENFGQWPRCEGQICCGLQKPAFFEGGLFQWHACLSAMVIWNCSLRDPSFFLNRLWLQSCFPPPSSGRLAFPLSGLTRRSSSTKGHVAPSRMLSWTGRWEPQSGRLPLTLFFLEHFECFWLPLHGGDHTHYGGDPMGAA